MFVDSCEPGGVHLLKDSGLHLPVCWSPDHQRPGTHRSTYDIGAVQ